MHCPRDDELLEPVATGNGHGHICVKCRGLLLQKAVFEDRKRITSARVLADLNRVGIFVARDLRCPIDGSSMERRKVEGVQIDVCSGCRAVWLDSGELRQLLSGSSPSIAEELMGHLLIGKLLDIFEG